MKRIIAAILTTALLCIGVSADDITDYSSEDSENIVEAVASGLSDYDVVFKSGTHGWLEAIFNDGWFSCSATTEAWGDQSVAVTSQTASVYVYLANDSKGKSNCSSATGLDSNRYCGCTASISTGSATGTSHSGSLTVSGTTISGSYSE